LGRTVQVRRVESEVVPDVFSEIERWSPVRLRMPELVIAQIYQEADVKHLVLDHGKGSTDWGRVRVRFPWPLDDWLGHDHENFRHDEEMVVQYWEFQIANLEEQIRERQADFAQRGERQKIEAILRLYENGEPVFPVFMQSNDPQQRICEGMHRAVALFESGSLKLPAFRTAYPSWFKLKQPIF
jgi:hypothetical protein